MDSKEWKKKWLKIFGIKAQIDYLRLKLDKIYWGQKIGDSSFLRPKMKKRAENYLKNKSQYTKATKKLFHQIL
jgi:hypothetical protein